MNKRNNLITAIVVGILVITAFLIYKYKPESSALTLGTSYYIELTTNQNNVAVYWKYPGITNYVYVKTQGIARQYVKVQCKRGTRYNIKLTKRGYRDYLFIAYCPKKTGTILLTPKPQ